MSWVHEVSPSEAEEATNVLHGLHLLNKFILFKDTIND